MPSSLEQAVNCIRSGDVTRGRELLAGYLKEHPKDENAWLWMSRCVTDPEQQKQCFERVLKIDPNNLHAIEGLSRLERSTKKATFGVPALVAGGAALGILCLIAGVVLSSALFKTGLVGTNPSVAASQSGQPSQHTIPGAEVVSQVQDYYANKLFLPLDLTALLGEVIDVPARDYFQVSDISAADQAVSGNEATVVVRLTFSLKEIPPFGSGNDVMLRKYFRLPDFSELEQRFTQERKFLFRQYESGNWRLENELNPTW